MTEETRVKTGDMIRVKAVYIAEDTRRDVEKYLAVLGRVGIVNQGEEKSWFSVTIDEEDYTFYRNLDKVEVLNGYIPVMRQALRNLRAFCLVQSGLYCLSPDKHQDHLVVVGQDRICASCLVRAIREVEEE